MNQQELRDLIAASRDSEDAYKAFIGDSDPQEKFSTQTWYKCTRELFGKTFTKIRHERINSNVEIIFKVDDSYFAESAYYQSYDGTNYDDIGSPTQVVPKEETVIVYHNFVPESKI